MHSESFTGERIVWQNPADHLKEFRQCLNYYMDAMQYAVGKRVIDSACGTGFGSLLLSLVASKVTAMDIHPPAEILRDNITVVERDFEKEPVSEEADLVVSIETIEHLANPDFFLASLKSPALFFTIPCYGNKNEFHKIEYSEESTKTLITKYFPNLTYRMEKGHMIGYATK